MNPLGKMGIFYILNNEAIFTKGTFVLLLLLTNSAGMKGLCMTNSIQLLYA
jgi:hypothetical protein